MAISVQKQFTVHIPSGQQASNQNVTIPAGKTMTSRMYPEDSPYPRRRWHK